MPPDLKEGAGKRNTAQVPRQTLGMTGVNTTACSQRDMSVLADTKLMIELPAAITHLVQEPDTDVHKALRDRYRPR